MLLRVDNEERETSTILKRTPPFRFVNPLSDDYCELKTSKTINQWYTKNTFAHCIQIGFSEKFKMGGSNFTECKPSTSLTITTIKIPELSERESPKGTSLSKSTITVCTSSEKLNSQEWTKYLTRFFYLYSDYALNIRRHDKCKTTLIFSSCLHSQKQHSDKETQNGIKLNGLTNHFKYENTRKGVRKPEYVYIGSFTTQDNYKTNIEML